MSILVNIFKLSAGIGLFLLAMYLIEESLKNLSGRNFKLFLQKITKNKFGAVTGGAIVTGLLQSSSMVSIMVLAFVGAGVFTMNNAMAIILGANLGTTLDSWVIAYLGFKLNIEIISYPAICVGGLLLVTSGHKKKIKDISYFLFGFGLLFIALSYMKMAMENEVNNFDLAKYANMPAIVFLLIGFVITFLIQSSSVTMALALSALHAGILTFPTAAAIVLGSETGTTIKLLLSAIGGTATKKRVTLGNLLFNIFLTVAAFIFLKQILFLITDLFKIQDPLIGLVTFSTIINLMAIIIFLPFLERFSKFLEKFFKDANDSIAAFINSADIEEPETALELFQKETNYFIYNSMLFNLLVFEIGTGTFEEHPDFKSINEKRKFLLKNLEEKYEFIKQLQGELQSFYIELRTKLQGESVSQLNQLISSIRNAMYSVKSMKDVSSNINNLKRSSKNIKFDFFVSHKKETEKLYEQFLALFKQNEKVSFEKLHSIFNSIHNNYTSGLNDFYKKAENSEMENLDLTTIINFNRELFTSNKAMLFAYKDLLLEEKLAEKFDEISS